MNLTNKHKLIFIFLSVLLFISSYASQSDTVSFYYINTGLLNLSYDYPEQMHFSLGNFELGFCSSLGFKFGTTLFSTKMGNLISMLPVSFSYIPYNTNKKTFLNEIDLTLEANAWRSFVSVNDTSMNISYLDTRVTFIKRDLLTKFVNLKLYAGYLIYNPLDYKYFDSKPYIGASITLPVFYFYGSFDSIIAQNRERYFEDVENQEIRE
ncbi:MAG: hypothetical protein AB7T10_08340 [bacterium]